MKSFYFLLSTERSEIFWFDKEMEEGDMTNFYWKRNLDKNALLLLNVWMKRNIVCYGNFIQLSRLHRFFSLRASYTDWYEIQQIVSQAPFHKDFSLHIKKSFSFIFDRAI